MKVTELLAEAYGRLPDLVSGAVQDLSAEQLAQAPAPGANTVGWLVWHLTRVQDSHIAELLDQDQLYASGEWAASFGLNPDPGDTGYGHKPGQISQVRPRDAQALIDYYQAVHDRTLKYLAGLSEADLDRVVDEGWDPPVTLGARLISVLDDDVQHAGQAAYVRGLVK
ncbi:DinB family protein [Actinoplanes sp. TFC3]|uniref:mycothiol transferase n=1 Tax=Actinoplanes sp. TFC3 TaxID=1710355 RepID=UPI00082D9E24|nr:DinB family protein [Actinoplanes sp. TFC3]